MCRSFGQTSLLMPTTSTSSTWTFCDYMSGALILGFRSKLEPVRYSIQIWQRMSLLSTILPWFSPVDIVSASFPTWFSFSASSQSFCWSGFSCWAATCFREVRGIEIALKNLGWQISVSGSYMKYFSSFLFALWSIFHSWTQIQVNHGSQHGFSV